MKSKQKITIDGEYYLNKIGSSNLRINEKRIFTNGWQIKSEQVPPGNTTCSGTLSSPSLC